MYKENYENGTTGKSPSELVFNHTIRDKIQSIIDNHEEDIKDR